MKARSPHRFFPLLSFTSDVTVSRARYCGITLLRADVAVSSRMGAAETFDSKRAIVKRTVGTLSVVSTDRRSIRALLTAMRQVSVTTHKSSYGEVALASSYRYQNVVSLTVIDSRASPRKQA